jgi:hypothetical protein
LGNKVHSKYRPIVMAYGASKITPAHLKIRANGTDIRITPDINAILASLCWVPVNLKKQRHVSNQPIENVRNINMFSRNIRRYIDSRYESIFIVFTAHI